MSNKFITWPECDGVGYFIWSCCGDDIADTINETDLCPSCGEHCGDEKEDCDICHGEGVISTITKEVKDEQCRHTHSHMGRCLNCGHDLVGE